MTVKIKLCTALKTTTLLDGMTVESFYSDLKEILFEKLSNSSNILKNNCSDR